MKIIYRSRNDRPSFAGLGIGECCFKALQLGSDRGLTTLKPHSHSDFEIHFITNGHQIYEINGNLLTVAAGEMLIILPGVLHRMVHFDPSAEKLALSFSLSADSPLMPPPGVEFLADKTPPDVLAGLAFAGKEHRDSAVSALLCENRLLEVIVLILRLLGMTEQKNANTRQEPSPILAIAKQYISDNIEHGPTLGEVAQYCHISEKQLSRIFLRYENMTAFDFIRLRRAERARELVSDKSLSLRVISERMSFANEYYFNEFFKKSCGLPPGAYRKMI